MKSNPVSSASPVAVVVNDDPTQLALLTGLVTKAGLNPRAFAGAEEALADMTAAGNPLPAIIVTDLYMPGIDGWRFCRLLRSPEYAALNNIPILVVSATYLGAEPDRIASDLGAECFLPSPVDSKLFSEQIKAILGKERLRNLTRVLIVEDSKVLSGILKKTFDTHGYDADTAATIREASELFAKNPFDVAVIDYHLPDGSGDTLLDLFRAARPECVCLMMTTDPEQSLALDWMKRGAAAYLRKPFGPEYLIDLCDNARRERSLLRAQSLLELRTRELRESEERYRNLFDNAHEAIFVAQDGNLVYLNVRTAAQIGYTTEELKSKSFIEFIHPDDQAMVIDNHFKRMKGEKLPNIYTFRIIHKDGSIRWTELNAVKVSWKGKPATLNFMTDITDRKRAEEALKHSEERFRSMIQSLSDIIFIIDQSGQLTYESPAAARILGYPPGYFIGKSPFTHIHPDDLDRVVKDLDEVFGSVNPGTVTEFRYRKADGTWADLEALGNNQIDNPAISGIVLTVRDISDRKQAGVVLKESEAKYRTIFETTGTATIIINKDTTIALANAEFAALSGHKIAELEGKRSWTEFAVKEDLERMRRYHNDRRTEAGRAPKIYEFRFIGSDGNIRHCINNVGVIPGTAQSVASIMDITDRKRMEEALREANENMRRSQAIAHVGNWKLDLASGLFSSSAEALALLGFPQDAVPAFDEIAGLIHEDDRALAHEALQHLIQTGNPYSLDIRFRRRDTGAVINVISTGELLRDEGGQPAAVFGINQDITVRKAAEAEQVKLHAQLTQAQKMESIGRLAGGVAHDFNNMLSVILGYSELAIRKAGADNPLQRHLAQILDAARRSASLTRQLLAFARQQTIAPIVIDLNKTIESMLKMLHRLIGEDIELQWNPKADLWPVKIDPSQIDQILANLCINARDAISNVGKITIETENTTLNNDYCDNHAGFVPGDYLKITVSDDGYGMTREVQAKLFEPFFTTKEMGKGTGLGLATVYGIIKQNKGFINVYSEPGHGTSFTIYLMRHTTPPLQAVPAGPPAAAARGHETILLVEDEPPILEMATTMLEGQGYTVRAAVTPGEAIRLAREHKGAIDLLITDVVMPEMNGRDLAKNLMSLYPHLKRLFMSGYTANVIAHHGVLDEGVYFIQKPFSIDDLSAKVREVLDGNENNF